MSKNINNNEANNRYDFNCTCIKEGDHTSNAKGHPISRGDMISFYLLMYPDYPIADGTRLKVDNCELMTYNDTDEDGVHHLKIIDDDTLETVAEFTETESWYCEWAKQPCDWIGWGLVVKDQRDIKY